MDYKQTLEFLYAQLPMFHRIGAAAYKNDLTNTIALCEYLGNPHRKFRSIHVGGTNGKGSVSHILAAVCQASGMKTGLYVSPHYKDFRERIKVDGQYIPRKQVVDFVGLHREVIERIQPSFFELCVVMAFDWFARQHVDIAIIEVGLGGRLDSTNVITPLLSVITNISYDHQNLLGETLPLIAAEKAGIIKPGIPVVIGETHPESAPVFLKKAAEVGAPIVFADQHFRVSTPELRSGGGTSSPERSSGVLSTPTIYDVYKDGNLFLENLEADISGPFQAKNVATVLQSYEILVQIKPRRFLETYEVLRTGLKNLRSLTRFMGRWQIIGNNPTILCDSAHNEAGLQLAFEEIHQTSKVFRNLRGYQRLHIVTGFVNDKDVDKSLVFFPQEARYYFAKANIPRGLEAAILREKAAGFGLHGRAYSSVRNALKAAKRAAAPTDLILVIGSIFVVGEVL
ncbi:MAG: bifunctional folylpolyglutamate synthase/dihydrofolate synthase [Phycisphaerae bacterium]|nr:bifunctional folylpolyglutamate synthase/dihydrofolate synthase [Saprospiraceae bacterium]